MDNKSPVISNPAENEPSSQMTVVWDWPLRLFHWSMVSVVFVAGVTGFIFEDNWLDVHIYAGYALAVLLVFRLTWGYLGSHYSKFRTFPLSRDAVVKHLGQVFRRKPTEYLGHNPAGAVMIVVLLVTLVSLVFTGLIVAGGQEKLGPLAFMTSYKVGHFTEELHEFAAWVLVWAIVVHLLGVFVESRIFRHPIVRAMINGRKETSGTGPKATGSLALLSRFVLSVILTALVIGGATSLTNMAPLGWRTLEFPKAYTKECGDCHDAYHPSLRTAEAWQKMMSGLSDHYGEDASLDGKTTDSIKAFLTANAAGTFDTEVSHRMGRKNTPSLRMTDTRRWKKWHRDIELADFSKRAIGSKVNCNACHKDALSGRFDDANIQIPTGDKK